MGSNPDIRKTRKISREIVKNYIRNWQYEEVFYEQAASNVDSLCRNLLAKYTIRAIVTHRTKTRARLEAKLRSRAEGGHTYADFDDIRKDIVDLAGVRIALYFPSDREKIFRIINSGFCQIDHIQFPKPKKDNSAIGNGHPADQFSQRFDGYYADHFRVTMKSEYAQNAAVGGELQAARARVEIQVASVLMHAWAEVDHDLVYKNLTSGTPSRQELRLLDAINGLAHTGEVLLQELQTAMDKRVKFQHAPFSDQYELRSFLQQKAVRLQDSTMEHLDVLFHVLSIVGCNTPAKLENRLSTFKYDAASPAPVALLLLEHILTSLKRVEPWSCNGDGTALIFEPLFDDANDIDDELFIEVTSQRNILTRAVAIANILRFPEPSIPNVGASSPVIREVSQLYYTANQYQIPNRVSIRGDPPDRKRAWDIVSQQKKLWDWFRAKDILYQVALKLARLDHPNIVEELKKSRPSSGYHRQLEQEAFEKGPLRRTTTDTKPPDLPVVGERPRPKSTAALKRDLNPARLT